MFGGSFVGHYGEPFELLFQGLGCQGSAKAALSRRLGSSLTLRRHNDRFAEFARTFWHFHFLDASHGPSVDLHAVRLIVTRVRVDIVGLHVVSVN